jgi:hypothetical protein
VVRFTPLPLYPRYPLDRRLGGPQSRSGPREEEKILDPTQPIASRYTDYAIPDTCGIIDGKVILKCIFKKWGMKEWMVLS